METPVTEYESPRPTKRQKRKTVACRRCHAQKSRCSGEMPCSNCSQSNKECEYPERDRKVTVNESYIKQILAENERLKKGLAENENPEANDRSSQADAEDEKQGDNPLFQKEAWFMPYDPSPIFIGEAACAAFSTRLRQLLKGNPSEQHIPRTHFISDAQLTTALNTTAPWPSRPQAFLLIDTALNTIGKQYHLSPASAVRNTLERAYQDTRSVDQLAICKLFLLFALGDAYSTRLPLGSTGQLPGIYYFARAKNILRIIPERPRIDHIEILVMFALYSLIMNRRHSAYRFVGSALRLGLTIGLYQNMAERQLPDRVARQRRVRLWWTIYILDRMMSSKVGFPPLLRDEDIELDLPTNEGLTEIQQNDFVDSDYMAATISLARISGSIISNLYRYSRKVKIAETFSRRVQAVFRELRDWVESLPPSIQLKQEESSCQVARHIVMLHLFFNQCVILATRPILLHVFRTSVNGSDEEIPKATSALAATCAHSARHSYRLLMRSWINGSFSIFDCSSAQFLFAAATTLVISSLSYESNSQADQNDLESAKHLLGQLSSLGNLAASEFNEQIEAVIQCVPAFRVGRGDQARAEVHDATLMDPGDLLAHTVPDTVTTEMAIFGPILGDFLTQTDTELGVPLLLEDNTLDWGAWTAVTDQDSNLPGQIDLGL